jgi:hypothetical protein
VVHRGAHIVPDLGVLADRLPRQDERIGELRIVRPAIVLRWHIDVPGQKSRCARPLVGHQEGVCRGIANVLDPDVLIGERIAPHVEVCPGLGILQEPDFFPGQLVAAIWLRLDPSLPVAVVREQQPQRQIALLGEH